MRKMGGGYFRIVMVILRNRIVPWNTGGRSGTCFSQTAGAGRAVINANSSEVCPCTSSPMPGKLSNCSLMQIQRKLPNTGAPREKIQTFFVRYCEDLHIQWELSTSMRWFSGDTHRFRPAHVSLFFLVMSLFFFCPAGDASSCGLSENACPVCLAGGLALNDSSAVDYPYPDTLETEAGFARLTCNYGDPLSLDTVTMVIDCFKDPGVAEKWYRYYRKETPYPVPDSQYAPANPRATYQHGTGHRVSGVAYPGRTYAARYAYSDWDFAVSGRYEAEITSTSPYDTAEEQNKASARNIGRINQFTACFASFKPGSVPAPVQQELKGTIYATRYPSGIPQPLKYARVTLLEEGKKVLGAETDADGKYTFAYAFGKGKNYRIEIGLAYTRGDTEYFTLYYSEPVESKKVIFRHDFTYAGDADLKQDVNLDDLWKKKSDTVNPFGIMYIHFCEAYEFYADYLKEDVHLHLPLKIVLFSNDPAIAKDRARYDSDGVESDILISPRESIPESELRPISEYHEFSHYMMANTWGREPEPLVTGHGEEINHGGFLNPSTTDSWAEGFANFMAGAIAEHTQLAATAMGEFVEPCDGASHYGALEDNYKPWEYHGQVEEAAVAGTLWDLFDSPGQKQACEARKVDYANSMIANPAVPDDRRQVLRYFVQGSAVLEQRYGYTDDFGSGYDDRAGFTMPQMWAVMRTYHPDLYSFYEGLTRQYPGSRQQIDEVFLMHGFWKETSPGNGKYDTEEPYRDTSGNKAYDAGEDYVDLAEDLAFTPGETVGTAADANRSWRRTTVQLPGQFVKVNNDAPYYSYTVEYPGTKRWPHTNYAFNSNGLIFVPVPPDPQAQITVKAIGVETGNPLVFTSQQFRNNYTASVRQGYYASHEFQLKGTIPPRPKVPVMEGAGTGPLGILLKPEGPLAVPGSRTPAFIWLVVILCGGAGAGWYLLRK